MNLRLLITGFALGLLVGLAPSCGSGVPCSPSSCAGCCDETGECLAGTGLLECGAGGAACARCADNERCSDGACSRFDVDYDASFPMERDGGPINPDAGLFDAGVPVDAGRDAGSADAGRADAGVDAGRPDAGADAGGVDAGVDAGQADAGQGDAATPDAGDADDAGEALDAGPDGG